VKIEPGVVTRRSAVAGTTQVEAVLDLPQATRLSWTAHESVSPVTPREARWLSDVKTLVTLGETDLALTLLVDVSVLQGDPARFDLEMPAGFEVVDVSGETLVSTEAGAGHLGLVVRPGSPPHHQFLVLMERATTDTTLAPPLLSILGSQRATGEVAIAGVGTLELTAMEKGTLQRLDVREASPALRSLAQQPLLAAFRYHRRPGETLGLDLKIKRFPDAPVLAALAEQAVVTTLVTTQGRTLTEVTLTVRNHAQPFLKVGLPPDAQLLSAEVAGERVKPVLGKDGARVPLLRAGFRPTGPYSVSFVYTLSGAPFGKKGDAQLSLASIDMPVTLLHWEVFLPDAYTVELKGGNVVPAEDVAVAWVPARRVTATITGQVEDLSGSVVKDASVTAVNQVTQIEYRTQSNDAGAYRITGLPAGSYALKSEAPGLKGRITSAFKLGAAQIAHANLRLERGAKTEQIELPEFSPVIEAEGADDAETVTGSTALALPLNGRNYENLTLLVPGAQTKDGRAVTEGTGAAVGGLDRFKDANVGADLGKSYQKALEAQRAAPSLNVKNLQRRVAGVLPVGVEVPREGTSHRFARALVLDEETDLIFRYKRR